MSVYDARVKAGAALLDQHLPGWMRQIDLTTLDLGQCDRCVLGQLYGGYTAGRDKVFGINRASWGIDVLTTALGFSAPDGFRTPSRYARLTAAWKAYIRKWRK